MYIGYSQDRTNLGFRCIKDIRAAKQISNLINFLKRTKGILVVYLIRKYNQLLIIIFSKEVLFAAIIFKKFISLDVNPDVMFPPPSGGYRCWIEMLTLEERVRLSKYPYPV